MRGVRALSTSAPRAKQALFQLKTGPTATEKNFITSRKRGSHTVNPWLARDAKTLRAIFNCNHKDLQKRRSEFALRIAAALGKIQDSRSFQVKDLSLDNLWERQTIAFPHELSIMDLYNPLGIPPGTPKAVIPAVHDPSLVAKTLSEAGFTGSFLQVDLNSLSKRPWPQYDRVARGGFVYSPRLEVDADHGLGSVALTLPGATIEPLYEFFKRFSETNVDFKVLLAIVSLWARSHGLELNPQTLALMVVASMQSEDPAFDASDEQRGWANVYYTRQGPPGWGETVSAVQVDFRRHIRSLPCCEPEVQLVNFFQHWRNLLFESSLTSAFTVRQGRANQLIPRQFLLNGYPAESRWKNYGMLQANIQSEPTEDFPPWRFDRFVMQDPFLVTHNHAENLSSVDTLRLLQKFQRFTAMLHGGRPLMQTFGSRLAPPGSDAEATILAHPKRYSAAFYLLEPDRVPKDLITSDEGAKNPVDMNRPVVPTPLSTVDEPDPRLRRVPWSSKSQRRFHTSSVALGRHDAPIAPPRPVAPLKRQKPEEDVEGWGLNPAPVREPTFWRPGPEPLKLPTRDGSPGLVPPARPTKAEDIAGWALNPAPVREPTFSRPGPEPVKLPTRDGSASLVPPARPTKAGVAYKTRRSFHTSAVQPDTTVDHRTDSGVLFRRKKTLSGVKAAIQKTFGDMYTVELFGSTRYGISSASSDLDMVVLDPTRKHGFAPDKNNKRLPPIYNLRSVSSALRKAGFKIVDTIAAAAVPIVIFTDPRTGLSCDININDRLGLMNTYLIKRYCELNPALVDMIAYIKQWAKPLGLNSPSSRNKGPITFSSYALVMMSIGFLQHRGLLPNLQEGLPPLKPGILHGTFWLRLPKPLCCDTRYKEKTDWTPPETVPIHELMRDWFKFWALEFNMDEEMMSIRHGGRILRSSLLEEGPFRGVLWNIDPFIRTKNLTQNLDRHSLSRFKLDCYRYSMMPEFELGALPPVLVTASKKKKDKNAPKDADIELAFTRVTEEAEEILDDSARQPWSDDDALPAQTRALSDTPTPTSFSDDAAPAVADSPPAWARPLSDTPSPTSFSDDSAPAVAGLPPTWARPVSDTRTPSDDSAPAVADLPPAWARTLSDTPAPTSDSASTVAGLPPTWTQPLPDTPSMPSFSDDYASAVAGLPAAWTQPLSDTPSPIAFLNNSSVVASDTAGEDVEEDVRIESEESGVEEEERLDYDPAIRLDTYGRIIEPEEPQQVIPEEPEEDLVGWGLKGDPAISSDTYGRGIEAQEEPEQPPKIAVGCALQSS